MYSSVLLLVCLVVANDARLLSKRAAGDQNPKVWDALAVLRGKAALTAEEIQALLENAVAGQDYPVNAAVPEKEVDCSAYKTQGFYADASEPSKCQVFHRCDTNGQATSYLCPNRTLFNQITLICDWFYNIDCAASAKFQDYSNSRLDKENEPLLDNQDEIAAASGAIASKAIPAKPSKPVAPKAPPTARKSKAEMDAEKATEENKVEETTAAPAETEAPQEAAATEAQTEAPEEAATESPTQTPEEAVTDGPEESPAETTTGTAVPGVPARRGGKLRVGGSASSSDSASFSESS